MSFALVVHGHFYQPPRENPWTDHIEREPSAAPFHDWNDRIHAECYRANAFARIHDRGGRIQSIVNNYQRLSYNFGPTLARWIERTDPRTHGRLLAADGEQRRRLGAGGAMAQAYAHPIVPLCSPADRRTQLLWGLADFRRRFGRPADGLWLPETAANVATLATLIDLGVQYTIVAPEQVAAVRAPGEEWTSVDRDTVDTGRAYRWQHPDGSGRFLTIAVFDGPLSRGVAFGDATRDASTFLAMARASAERSHVSEPPLVLCASDGELYGHHKKFADLNLAFSTFVEGPRQGIQPTNLGAYLQAYPATWQMALAEGPDGKGTSWSCAHGVGRWWRDCGCTMAPSGRPWNHAWRTPLRAAMDCLQTAAAHFYEDAGAQLLVDPWGARDAYGEVVDAGLPERDAVLAEFATEALANGGEEARERARLLLEMQRATLLMYASCGWYFDDVTGLEASLVLRLAAHAADLMTEAGGVAPVDEMLDLLATARSNEPGGQTGADQFRRGASDRVTPERAVAAVAVAVAAAPGSYGHARSPSPVTPGFDVEVVSQSGQRDGRGVELVGEACATGERSGAGRTLPFAARWEVGQPLHIQVDGVEIQLRELGRESRNRLVPVLLPRLLEMGAVAPVPAARLALDLGQGLLANADASQASDGMALQRAYARLLLELLSLAATFSQAHLELALQLLEAAGSQLGAGSPARGAAEELVAEKLVGALANDALARFAGALGFAAARSDTDGPGGADGKSVFVAPEPAAAAGGRGDRGQRGNGNVGDSGDGGNVGKPV